MDYSEIIEEVRLKVPDANPSVIAKIPDLVNDAVAKIAEEAKLPELKTLGSVTTVLAQNYVNMPSGFSGILKYCGTSTGKITILEGGLEEMLEKHPGLDEEGDVSEVAVEGSLLYYQGIPTTATILTLVYYEDPPLLVNDTDVPTCIPIVLHRDLIIPKTTQLVFSLIEEGLEDGLKINTKAAEGEYDGNVYKLHTWIARRSTAVGGRKAWKN